MKEKSALAGKEIWGIGLLALINLLLFADQNLMAPNLTQIAHDFGLSDMERDVKLGGNISLVFFVLGAVVTLFIALSHRQAVAQEALCLGRADRGFALLPHRLGPQL